MKDYLITIPSFSHLITAFIDFAYIWNKYPHDVLELFVFALNIWANQISIISLRDYIRCIRCYSHIRCNYVPSNPLLQDAADHITEYTKRCDPALSFGTFLHDTIVSHPYFVPLSLSPEADMHVLNGMDFTPIELFVEN